MKTKVFFVVAGLVAGWIGLQSGQAKELKELKVLYVGSERTSEFVPFLKKYVAQVESQNRGGFKLADAASFDVVLLDWPQGEETREMRKLRSPLGKREDWNKPTVLLGSAGLNLAVSWKLKGGSGCTCMDPLAYDLRSHEIFEHPFKIARSKMVRISTPPDFREEIKESEIEVLPLVTEYERKWRPGWCSYANDFERNPDVEYFCGGVNHKTPTAAGLWRQGNLLHFGFEQSPTEMNEQGQHLLLNSIEYISRFTEDRPIAVTPSVFAGPVARSRAGVARNLLNGTYQLDWVKEYFNPKLWAKLAPLGREKMAEWVKNEGRFLHPNSSQQLEVDEDLAALGVPFDTEEFFTKTIADLGAGGAPAERSQRLLKRYAAVGPAKGTAEEWTQWWTINKSYLFASDSGDYCWYWDALAKNRGVPSKELRGPKRADAEPAVATK